MVKTSSINKIKIFSAVVLLVSAIIIYMILHGTKDLIIVRKINQFCRIIPLKNGMKVSRKFVTGYLVDILWFNSFCLLFSIFKKKGNYLILILLACIFECAQLKNAALGTFDFIDLLIYIVTGTGYYIFESIITKPKGS